MTEVRLKGVRIASLVVMGAVALVVAYVLAARFGRTQEIEWMEGSMLDHVERFTKGEPLYVKPSIAWTPILYPPGYFWTCAQLSHVMSIPIACRFVSVVSSIWTAVAIALVSRKLGTSWAFAVLGALLYVGCFGYVLEWFDAQRVDPLFVALSMTSALVLVSSDRAREAAIAGALLGLAFFVKQQAAMYLVAIPVTLFFLKRAKHALALAGSGALVIAPLFFWIQHASNGWFSYYVFKLPSTHGMDFKYLPGLLFSLVFGFALVFATISIAIELVRRKESHGVILLGAFVMTALFISASTRLHPGSWNNNLVHWTAFACPAFAWTASRATPRGQTFACGLAALQCLYFAPNPKRSIPTAESQRASDAFEARVRDLEKDGEVIALTRGHVTAKRHAHYQALNDLLIGGDTFPEDFREGISSRAYAAIIVDDIERIDVAKPFGTRNDLFDLVASNYEVAERLPEAPPPIIGYGSVPRIVLRPRAEPLHLDHAALVERMR